MLKDLQHRNHIERFVRDTAVANIGKHRMKILHSPTPDALKQCDTMRQNIKTRNFKFRKFSQQRKEKHSASTADIEQ